MSDVIEVSDHKELLAIAEEDVSYEEMCEILYKARRCGDKHDVKTLGRATITEIKLNSSTYDLDVCRQKPWISFLSKVVAVLNNCVVVIANRVSNKQNISYEFKGTANDTELCVDMLTYIVDTFNQRLINEGEALDIKGVAMKNAYLIDGAESLNESIYKLIDARKKELDSSGILSAIASKKQILIKQAYGKPRYKDYYMV